VRSSGTWDVAVTTFTQPADPPRSEQLTRKRVNGHVACLAGAIGLRCSLRPVPTLVILRHGQSTWNAENRFTGWTDVDLSARGEEEAREAGRLMAAEPALEIDTVHTSVLKRAVRTANLTLDEMDRSYLPVRRHWRLNERHYGALQGLNKREMAELHGAEQVRLWRRSYDVPPPPVGLDDPNHPVNDARYHGVPPSALPATECLADVVRRLLPYWEDAIGVELLEGRTVLVVAHGNSLRALAKELEEISDADIVDLNIPTGFPRVYDLDDRLRVRSACYLGDPAAASAAAEAVALQAEH
jgi:2,3-bisphosphoglycerate-dependent phosphoglycerate mutase